MRFIFKTDYGQDINLVKHGGHRVLVWADDAGAAGGALALRRVLAGPAHLRADLLHRGPGPDAAGRLHRALLDRARGVPGRRRVHAGGVRQHGRALPDRAGARRPALGGGGRGRRPAGAARERHLPRHRHAVLRLHRRGGAGALGVGHRRQLGHPRQAPGPVRLQGRLRDRLLLPVPRDRGGLHARDPQPAALAHRARLRRHPRLGDLRAEHGHPPGALQDAVVRAVGGAGRHRRRAVRAQAVVHLARPVQHPAVDRPAADGGDRRAGLGARRLPGRDLPDLHAAGDRADQGLPAAGDRPGARPAGAGLWRGADRLRACSSRWASTAAG